MRKYIATPQAEVIGSAMQNLFVSINRDEFLPLVEQTFTQYGVDNIQDKAWYPHQLTLDIFKLIEDAKLNSMDNLVSLGMAYVETATFPPQINSVYSALSALSQTYGLNIRNAADGEGYEVQQLSDQHIQIIDQNPFPHDTVYGFIWGIAKRFRANQDKFPSITRTYLNPDDPNSDGAIYDVML
ncbi:MAG: hypothetical protein ABI690_07930 [Chloroflexota bacterium]